MAPQGQDEQGLRPIEINIQPTEGDNRPAITDPSNAPGTVPHINEIPGGDIMPPEPTTREIEAGANSSVAYFEDATGQSFPPGPMGEKAANILYRLNVERENWSEAMERDSRASLQMLFPDVGGSRINGPL